MYIIYRQAADGLSDAHSGSVAVVIIRQLPIILGCLQRMQQRLVAGMVHAHVALADAQDALALCDAESALAFLNAADCAA